MNPPRLDFDYDKRDYGKTVRFLLQLDAEPLGQLLDDGQQGLRLTELLQLERPSDLLPYLWLRVAEAPAPFQNIFDHLRKARAAREQELRPWPEGAVPLYVFDPRIWHNWDEEPWESTWLEFRNSGRVRTFLTNALSWLREETDRRMGTHPLFQHVRSIWQAGRHQHLFIAREALREPLRTRTLPDDGQQAFVAAGVSRTFDRLMRDADVVAVSIRDQDQPGLVWAMAGEQRRRAALTGHPLGLALQANALGYDADWNAMWDSEIWFFSEGLAESDLLADLALQAPVASDFWPNGLRWLPGRYLLCAQDLGELPGFVGEPGDECWVYRRIDPPSRRQALRRSECRRGSHLQGTVADFGTADALLLGWERVLIVVGPTAPAAELQALDRLLVAWAPHRCMPALWVEGNPDWHPAAPQVLRVSASAAGAAADAPQPASGWLQTECPWLDLVVLMAPSPTQIEQLTPRLTAQQDPYPAHVMAAGEVGDTKVDSRLPGLLSSLLDQALARVQKW
jgi:hypothetical protein